MAAGALVAALALAAAAPAEQRVAYGADPLQYGELRLPPGPGPHPLAVVLHGGCWSARYGLDLMRPASEALRAEGIATWTIEYRRVGDPGGGWRGTFEDVARGVDHVKVLAQRFPLDTHRVVLVGHSAGGQLALWAAAWHSLGIRGVVGLGAITDLRAYGAGPGGCNAGVAALLGGSVEEVPERYADANPLERLPLRVPVRLIQGDRDAIVPASQGRRFAAEASGKGDDARVRTVGGAGHFELIDPATPAWKVVVEEIRALLGTRPRR